MVTWCRPPLCSTAELEIRRITVEDCICCSDVCVYNSYRNNTVRDARHYKKFRAGPSLQAKGRESEENAGDETRGRMTKARRGRRTRDGHSKKTQRARRGRSMKTQWAREGHSTKTQRTRGGHSMGTRRQRTYGAFGGGQLNAPAIAAAA